MIHLQATCFALLIALSGLHSIYASVSESQGKSSVDGSVSSAIASASASSSSPSASSVQAGPEARQISSSPVGSSSSGVSSASGSSSSGSFPSSYSLYQNALLNAALPQTPSTSGSWLSILRPTQGGRRASLTSRLRNIYNAIFR